MAIYAVLDEVTESECDVIVLHSEEPIPEEILPNGWVLPADIRISMAQDEENADDIYCLYVIRRVFPVWEGDTPEAREELAECYRSCLQLAVEHDCRGAAFPLVSAGGSGCPVDIETEIAVETIRAFQETHVIDVELYFDSEEDCGNCMDRFPEVEEGPAD